MQSFVFGQRATLLVPALAVTIVLTAPFGALAQTDTVAADGTGVARVSVIAGNVAIQRGDSADSLAAAINAPVLGGDYITTGDASRTEIQFDGSSVVRLGTDAQLRFTHIDTGNRTVQLAQGTLELRLLQNTDGVSEIDTPSVAIKPQTHGAYRVTVTSDGQTLVTVRSGRAEVDTPQSNQDLEPGTTLVAQGTADNPSIQTVAAVAPDDFDSFNAERDRAHERALASAAFVNSDIDGVEDLDTYGHWVTDGSYGHVWVPASVSPDWAPYRDGRWVWEDGYGWTWVAAEPWGWAPYHYGSWYHSPSYGWCWYPAQPRIYSPWRPALVAFIGFGGGSSFSLGFGNDAGFGNIGWVPLAPFETYHPWWGNRYGYGGGGNTTIVNNVINVTNVTNITNVNVYHNVQYNAVSSVTSQRFLQGNFVHNTPVAATELRSAHVFGSAVPIVPTASNLRFTSATERPAVAVHPGLLERSFAGNPAVVHRTAFTAQRVALATATHAQITPLNFKDEHATPLVTTSRDDRAPAPRVNDGNVHTSAQPGVPARAAGSTDPWTRFNASRGNAYHEPAQRPAVPAQTQTLDHTPATSVDRAPAPTFKSEIGTGNHGSAESSDRPYARANTVHETTSGGADHPPATQLPANRPVTAAHTDRETQTAPRLPSTYQQQTRPTYQQQTRPTDPQQTRPTYQQQTRPGQSESVPSHAAEPHVTQSRTPTEHTKSDTTHTAPETHHDHPANQRRS